MIIGNKKTSRLDKLIEKLEQHRTLIESVEKGSIEVNYAGDSQTVLIKIVA